MNDHLIGNTAPAVHDGACARRDVIDLCSDHANVRSDEGDAKIPLSQTSSICTQTQPMCSQFSQGASQHDADDDDHDPDAQRAITHSRSAAFDATVAQLMELHRAQQQLLKLKKSAIHGELFQHLAAECKKIVFAQSAVRARCSLGVLQTNSNSEYHDQILPLVAADVDNKIVNTVVENIDVKYHGVRLFVKLLYGTFDTLPSQELIDTHFRIAHKLAMECFPTEQKHLHNAVTRRWMPRLKYNNNARGDSLPMARQSVAIVWPHIVINDPNELACFWTTLDMRLTAHSPQFANPVDVCALRLSSSRARLQTVYSHKIVPCRQCRVPVDGLANYESSDEENQTRPIKSQHPANKRVRTPIACICNNEGIIVQEGSVEPYCELQWDSNTSQTYVLRWNAAAFSPQARSYNTVEMLRLHSIVPNTSHCQLPFFTPADAPSARDAIGFNVSHKLHSPFGRDLLCKLDENKFFSKILKMKTTFRLKAAEHVELYQLCLSLIRNVGASFSAPLKLPSALCKQEAEAGSVVESPYAHLVIHDIACNTTKKRLYINVQGRGSKYCYLHGGEHDETIRIYFTISIDSFYVSVACNNPACQKTITSYFDWLSAKKDNPKKNVTPNLTDVEMELLSKKMHYVISIEGDTRKKLMQLALNKNYTGPMERTFTLRNSEPPSSQSMRSRESDNLDDDSMEDSDQEHDLETCVRIPRRLLDSPLEVKLAFINKRNTRKRAKHSTATQLSLPGRLAVTEPFVEEVNRTVRTNFDAVTAEQLRNWKNQPSKFL